ncbi:MAG TPA: N-acetylmuramic acid 6-phosphate etherase [Acetobacteraceae bacterium]|nr:N-acetylmuramic acid 6-phosphate etherase [Acetobacteraceae bacterium]
MSLPDTEAASARYAELDAWDLPTILTALWESQLAAVAALGPALPALARAVQAASARLRGGGRLAYAGAGTSGRIAIQDGAELAPTFDWPEERLLLFMAGGAQAFVRAVENAEDRADQARAEIGAAKLGPADVLVGVAASGTTPYAVASIEAAREIGALTIGIANSRGTPLLQAAEIPVLIETGTEAIAGSTRMKAGTAQKVALNLFSTALMVHLGRVYRGRMVDMLARNEKLRRRAVRMVTELTGCTEDAARVALGSAGGKVKLAVLMVFRRCDTPTAERLLAESGGDLRAALQQ